MLEKTKQYYINMLVYNNDFEEAKKKIALSEKEPLFDRRFIHAEEDPCVKDYNTMLLESSLDLTALEHELMNGASELKVLADTIALRFKAIEMKLNEEKMIRDHMKLLCNAFENFQDIVHVDRYMEKQTCSYIDGLYYAGTLKNESIPYDIVEITGNGMAGNAFILDEKNNFIEQIRRSDFSQAFKDDDKLTYYDYQRLTVKQEDSYTTPEMHYDTIPARCDILLKAKDTIENCTISANTCLLTGMFFSNDGINFTNALSENYILNQSNNLIKSDFLSLPSAEYVKLSFESIGDSLEKIGFYSYDNKIQKEKLIKLDSGKRHLIRIHEIVLQSHIYIDKSYFKTTNLLPYPVQSVAIYADIYYPGHLDKKEQAVDFEIIVNNKSYSVVPINSDRNGKKIIASSSFDFNTLYAGIYINEPLTKVEISMQFNCSHQHETAVVKNLKLLIGDPYEN